MVTDQEEFQGYKPDSIRILKKFHAKTWSRITIKGPSGTAEGVILPRSKFAPDGWVEIKLKNGYNIGIALTDETKITVVGEEPPMEVKFDQIIPKKNKTLPSVKLLGTGGTISSRLDYVTGGVIPAFEPGELYTAVPELAEVCNLDTEVVYQIFSENITPQNWLQLAQKVAKIANSGDVAGILIAHGTDTMSYTSAALSFLLKDLRVPVVLVGSQRSSDRPSSDAAMNLIHAARIAGTADCAEVVVCMLGSSAHDYGFIHRGTRVRKMHSSRRDAFRSVGMAPLGMIQGKTIRFFAQNYRTRPTTKKKTTVAKKIEDKIGMIYIHPGLSGDILNYYLDEGYAGIILVGTGLGHVPHSMYNAIKRAREMHVPIVMTVQTLWGYTGMNVYETGRELLALGVMPGKNMLPETAFAKLAWVMGNYTDSKEIRRVMQTNIAGEITLSEPMNGYQIFQGVESLISSGSGSSKKSTPKSDSKPKRKSKKNPLELRDKPSKEEMKKVFKI